METKPKKVTVTFTLTDNVVLLLDKLVVAMESNKSYEIRRLIKEEYERRIGKIEQ